MLGIHIVTLFPEMFQSVLNDAIFQRAADKGLVSFNLYNIRDYTYDKHHTVDDCPYGGGAGMVLKPDPVFEAVEAVKTAIGPDVSSAQVILLTPQGRLFSQSIARELAQHRYLIFVCGHYEGVDERIREHLVTDEISIGDYVLSGGELPAMVVMDATIRLVSGVLGSEASVQEESHAAGLLEYPQYTRPGTYREWSVPDILLSGNHAGIARWRRQQAIRRTWERRPDLLEKAELSSEDKQFLQSLKQWCNNQGSIV